jgi:3-hydroxyacyl-CoA dehydrogenase/enoyl-CoA hydratase/3-hydroxybutyryl-CoA epimerase
MLYDDKGKRVRAVGGSGSSFGPFGENQPDLTEVQHRLLFVQVLEAVRALEEGVLTDIREGDVGAILGWGFAPWSGGPFSWLDIIGAGKAVELCDQLEKTHGERFRAPKLLRDMASKGETFYARFDQSAKAA